MYKILISILLCFLFVYGSSGQKRRSSKSRKKKSSKSVKNESTKSTEGKLSKSTEDKLSKSEAKKWKAKLKQTTPEQFKALFEGYNVLTKENSSLRKQLDALENQPKPTEDLEKKDKEIEKLNKQIDKAKEIIEELKTNGAEDNVISSESEESSDDAGYTKGIVYKVQIGAFRDAKLSEFTANGNWWEEETDGLKKYTIGYFRDYFEASLFKKYMKAMGVKGPWVVAYENNVRTDIKAILNR